MTELLARKPSRWITYKCDARGNIGLLVGPNTFGEILIVVAEQYNEEDNSTRVGFAYTDYRVGQ